MKDQLTHDHHEFVRCTKQSPFKLSGMKNLYPELAGPPEVCGPKRHWSIIRFTDRRTELSKDGLSRLEDSLESIRHGRYRSFKDVNSLLKELHE